MKDKIKKFYDDHEYKIGIALNTVALITIAGCVTAVRGKKITGVGKGEHDGFLCIKIDQKNGQSQFWHWTDPKKN